MDDTDLDTLNKRVAECDKHHHFYHYKSSWQHLCFANALRAAGAGLEAEKHYKAAVFQDHLNEDAKRELVIPRVSLSCETIGESTNVDCPIVAVEATRAMTFYDTHITSGAIDALVVFEASLGWEPDTSMELCERGKFEEALRASSARHDRYHKHASASHLERGKYFMEAGEIDLAIADFSKALDLHGKNTDALRARADAYEKKGAYKMAEEDKLRLPSIALC